MCRILVKERREGEAHVSVVKEREESTPTSTEEAFMSSTATRTLMDRIVHSENQEYERLINDNTRNHFEGSPERSNVGSDNFAESNSDCDAQTSEDPATDSDIESDTDSGSSDFAALIAEEMARRGRVRRAYMLEQLALRSSRRTAHLVALGRLGFPVAEYTIM